MVPWLSTNFKIFPKAQKINNEIKMKNDARIEWIIMACKGTCVRHKALGHMLVTVIVILVGRNDVKYVISS
jgi:hypothetical protein